jgi:hypothetical protein
MMRLWYELRGSGTPALTTIGLGLILTIFFVVLNTERSIGQVHDIMIFLATTLGLALALLPSPATDRAWELTRNAAEPDGTRELLHSSFSLGMIGLCFAALTWYLNAPLESFEWFIPRAIWFSFASTATILATRNTSFAVGIVALLFILPYCPMPREINPNILQEPRFELHLLTAIMALLVPFAFKGFLPRRTSQILVALSLSAFALFPLWRLQNRANLLEVIAPKGFAERTMLLIETPWARFQLAELNRFQIETRELKGMIQRGVYHYPNRPYELQKAVNAEQFVIALGIHAFPIRIWLDENGKAKVLP